MKIFNFKTFIFFGLIIVFAVGSYFIGSAQRESSKTVWQYSVSNSIRLGVRQLQGKSDSKVATFTVTGEDKKQYSAQTTINGEVYGYVEFPQGFGISSPSEGKYYWTCKIDGKIVTRGNFDYLNSETKIEQNATGMQANANSDQNIKTKIGDGADDLWLWTKIRTTILKDEETKNADITIDVENSKVTLRGTVFSEAQKIKIEKLARNVEGVKEITNNLRVISK